MLDGRDADRAAVAAALEDETSPYLVPAAVFGEAGYFIEARLGQSVLDLFLADLEEGAFTLDCGEPDMARARELTGRFADLPLGLVDAAVIACAERNG